MSFSGMNGVIAGRGMQGTARQGTATFPTAAQQGGGYQSGPGPQQGGGYQSGPGPQQGPPAPPKGSSYTHGAGMQMTGRYAGQSPVPPAPVDYPPQMKPGPSASAVNKTGQLVMNTPNANGVVAGQTMPSAVGPQVDPQFDPNDPNNAALQGYLMAR